MLRVQRNKCSEYRGTAEFDAHDRTARRACTHCASLHSLTKVKRYAQNTVRGHRAELLVFFDWCTRERIAVANPVQVKVPAPVPTIRHYPVDVVRQLCAYVAVPGADPTKALMLYFNALSVQELRDARIPIIRPLRQDSPIPGLAEAYYLLLPKPPLSLGDHSPGRPDVGLDFPGSAASWLRPLLERFEWQRKEAVQNPANDYLFVSAASARRDMSGGNVFIWNVVRRASLRLLGGSCSPNTLRKSVGILFADRAGAGILRWMGWDDHQAFAYTWADRELVHPRQNENAADGPAGSSQTDITFPSLLGGTS